MSSPLAQYLSGEKRPLFRLIWPMSAQGLTLANLDPLPALTANDMVLIPGIRHQSGGPGEMLLDKETLDWLVATARGGTHMASICTGVFALGEAGLLNGRRCTTHWAYLEDLRALYPRARVLDNMLFVQDQALSTSAGVASGIDLALAFLEQKQGPLFAAQIARYLGCICDVMDSRLRKASTLSIAHMCIRACTASRIT